MLCSIKELAGLPLAATDGDIGHATEAYFDDLRWVIRHLVVDTGGWLTGRKVLIAPQAIQGIDRARHRIEVALARGQIEAEPDIDTARPVSRQHEIAIYDHYGWPYWWQGDSMVDTTAHALAGMVLAPPSPGAGLPPGAAAQVEAESAQDDPHLRSSTEVVGYHVAARDGDIGHIADFLFDERTWAIAFAVVDTGHWLAGRQVLIEPRWIERIDWAGRKVWVQLTRAAVESSPRYRHGEPLQEEQFRKVQRHFESSE
ncbi:PRC-barrel domain-containing protein [Azohydromonas caseinilytica]|uniref:PRC-barrel domain containing protein n=1 Tax=Azohydromonas caseinilytica TaxID=2728836 RepID=A0A848FJ00_9BURK|nr:PRC-barrel domain-containing protein [Azohydromonas caseinilytica]NML17811.1 PRC-barrel domain containing protein [Azohydromonas caseinilytica]